MISARGVLHGSLTCGGCGSQFEANVYTVPNFRGVAACRSCMTHLNDLRTRVGLPPWDYPVTTYLTFREEL